MKLGEGYLLYLPVFLQRIIFLSCRDGRYFSIEKYKGPFKGPFIVRWRNGVLVHFESGSEKKANSVSRVFEI